MRRFHGKKDAEKQIKNPIKKKITKKPKEFKCLHTEDCRKVFTTNKSLHDHVKIVHEKIKEFNCDLCGKNFGSNAILKLHRTRVHEKLKPHQCTVNTLLVVGGNRKSSKDYEVPPSENYILLCQ